MVTRAALADELDGRHLRAGFTTGTPYRALSANVATNNVAAQADAGSILAFYKAMLALRNARPSISQGSYDTQNSAEAWNDQPRAGT